MARHLLSGDGMMTARVVLLSVVCSVFSFSVSPGAECDSGRRVSGTPYDAYMSGVRRVYAGLNQGVASIDEIRAQLRVGRRYRYTYDPKSPYIPAMPAVTEAAQAGDCKGKSLWLAQKVGDRQCHFVMGKLRRNDRIAHAWLLWKNEGQWLILDPTWESEIVFAEQEVGRKWFARYSYNRSGAFVHPSYGQYVGL